MAKFIKSSLEKLPYRDSYLYNHPINIDLCISFRKSIWNNGWGGKYPSIIFDELDREWVYNSETLRDKDYNNIINNLV